MKRIAQRALPLNQKYKIVETFVSNDYCNCDNCGKALKNVAVINSDAGGKYYVGMDCAATLSGINNMDIEYFSQSFVLAKSVLAKVNRCLKTPGSVLLVTNFYYSKPNKVEILVLKKEGKYTCIADALCNFTIDADFCKIYLPSLLAKNILNLGNFERKQVIPENVTDTTFVFDGYNFEYKFTPYAHVSILDGSNIAESGSNAGQNFDAIITEATRVYNQYIFNSGKKHIE